MPIFHTQFRGQGQTPDGQTIDLTPAVALQLLGPRVQVGLGVAASVAAQLLAQGQTLPPPITGWALIDSGAAFTCIDEASAQQLQLPIVDVTTIASASHAAAAANVYAARIEFQGLGLTIDTPRAAGAPLAAQGLLVLIGRDVLQHTTLFYNGLSGEMTLSI